VVLGARQPRSYIGRMVIAEMVKEFTRLDALIVQAHKIIGASPLMHRLNMDIFGESFNTSNEVLKDLLRLIQDVAH
jgi:hypothetical protein